MDNQVFSVYILLCEDRVGIRNYPKRIKDPIRQKQYTLKIRKNWPFNSCGMVYINIYSYGLRKNFIILNPERYW